MAPVIRKRKRFQRPVTPTYRDSLLTIFAKASSDAHQNDERPSLSDSPVTERFLMARYSRLGPLCDRLDCISRPDTARVLNEIMQLIHTRITSISELADVLFGTDEDADMLPPLCATVRLLRAKCLHVADCRHGYVMKRAVYELERADACICGGSHSGILSIIEYMLDGHRGSRRDVVLRDFMSVYFHRPLPVLSDMSVHTRFRLATIIIKYLYEAWAKHGDRLSTLVTWARQAVIPSRFLEDADNNTHVTWTAELSGLATERSVQEYLPAGKSEQDSLMSLFAAIPSVEANSIYLSCVSDVLKFSEAAGNRKDPVPGTWSRLVLLGSRITDKDVFQDVDEGMRRAVVSSITGTLCSPACLKDPRAIATMICLARRVLIHQLCNKSDTVSSSLERYESWLRDLVRNPDAAVVRSLLDVLSELVPLETVHFLKLHHQIFTRNRGLFHLAATYLAHLRSRIRDFDPTFINIAAEGKSSTNNEAHAPNAISAKVMNEVVQFISSYKEKRELPKLLIRHMNFHRYHFRKVILPVLLHPNFIDLKPPDGDVSIDLEPITFDERRIDLIREIAFRRKDHAITSSEAKSAIESINAARSLRNGQLSSSSNIRAKHVLESSSIKGTSSIRDIVTAILRDETRHGLDKLTTRKDDDHIAKAKELLCANVGTCISKCNDTHGLASIATDVLEGLCSAVEDACRSKVPKAENVFETMQPLNFSDRSSVLENYKSLWRQIGLSFLSLLSYFMGDFRLARIQSHIRYQLLALICMRIDSVSENSLFSLSLIMVVLVILRSKAPLQNICFFGNATPSSFCHISLVVFECLPLSRPDVVLPSIIFTLHFVSLLTTFPEDALLSLNIESDISMDATLAYCGHESVVTEFANFPRSLLRWVISNPWRLTRVDGDAVKPEEGDITQEASALCQRALTCLPGITFSDGEAKPLATMLNLELRAQWGCKFAIASQLRVMHSLGLSTMAVVNEVVKFLAAAKKRQHYSLNWIHQGLLLFFEGITDSTPVSTDESASTNVRKCVEEAGIGVAYNMIEYYRSLELPYFKGCDDAFDHIAQVLILKMWPLSRQIAAYLFRCISSHDITMVGQIDPFFVASCSLVLGASRDSISLTEPPVDSNHGISELVRGVARESKIVLQQCCSDDFEHQGTNGNVFRSQFSDCNISTLSLLNAHSLGIALSMRLMTEFQYKANMVDISQQIVSAIVFRAGVPAACDVIDGVTVSIALLQCKKKLRDRWSTKVKDSCYDSLLSSFVQERVALCEGKRDYLPFWIKVCLSDSPDFGNGAGGALLKEWLDSAQESEARKEVQECIARLLSALDATTEGVVERVVRAMGHDKVIDTLLPNLGWAFVQTRKIYGATKVAIRRQLIGSIGRIADYIQPEVGGDFIAGAMNRFGTDGVEILALLREGGFR